MIIRLMGEGQYELDKNFLDEINKIDNNIVKIVNMVNSNMLSEDEKGKQTAKAVLKIEFEKLNDYVRNNGKRISDRIIKPSDLIIPPADLTLEEAKKIFHGEWLIKD